MSKTWNWIKLIWAHVVEHPQHTIKKNPLWLNLGWTPTFIMVSSTLFPSYVSPILNLPTHLMWFPTSLPNPLLITHPLQPSIYLLTSFYFPPIFFLSITFITKLFKLVLFLQGQAFMMNHILRSTFFSNGVFKCNLETRNKVENLFDF